MGILSDWQIKREVKITPFHDGTKEPGKISSGLTSYGYDVRCGYVGKVFSPIHATEIDPKNFDPKMLETIDLSLNANWKCQDCDGANEPKKNYFRIPPHSFMLAESLEEFEIPRDVLCIVMGKSTYARCGLIVNVTPGEPEWKGKWTIEVSNTTPLPARVYAGEGLMQAVFVRSDGLDEAYRKLVEMSVVYGQMPDIIRWYMESVTTNRDPEMRKHVSCQRSYADKKGKYQSQEGLTLPKVEGVSENGTESTPPV